MKLSKTTDCSLIPIKFPRWKERGSMTTPKERIHYDR